jgi:hypothetical protein
MINQDFISIKEKIVWPKSDKEMRKQKIQDCFYWAVLIMVLSFSVYVLVHF